MNYFIAELFRDWKWWAKIGFAFVATLNVADILSASFAYPGFFSLWIVKITAGAALIGLTVYMVRQSRQDKINRQIEILLPAFTAERRADFEKMVASDPKFQTFCFDCRHYDPGRRFCNLHLADREIKIKLHPHDLFNYCLYWNLSDHPILTLTERQVP